MEPYARTSFRPPSIGELLDSIEFTWALPEILSIKVEDAIENQVDFFSVESDGYPELSSFHG